MNDYYICFYVEGKPLIKLELNDNYKVNYRIMFNVSQLTITNSNIEENSLKKIYQIINSNKNKLFKMNYFYKDKIIETDKYENYVNILYELSDNEEKLEILNLYN